MRDSLIDISTEARVAKYWPYLLETFERYEINTPLRQAHFMSQMMHETGNLKYLAELWGPTSQQKKYDPPYALARKLGNLVKGEGKLFRGRGLCMLTGRDNYQKYAEFLNLESGTDYTAEDVVTLLTEDPFYQVDVAGWYWTERSLNVHADRDDAKQVTQIINGGYNGLKHRESILDHIKNYT